MRIFLVDDGITIKVIVAETAIEARQVAAKHDFGNDYGGVYKIKMLVPEFFRKAQIIAEVDD